MLKKEKFSERLTELMLSTRNITPKDLGEQLNINPYTIRCWKNGSRSISLSCAIKLVDFFNCSLDFLFGRSDRLLDFAILPYQSFYASLISYMKTNHISRYSIVQKTKFSNGNFDSWRKGSDPKIQTVIELADYLQCTLDVLVGRDK